MEKSVIDTVNEIVLQNTIGEELSLIFTDPSNLKSDSFQELLINGEIIGSSNICIKQFNPNFEFFR